MFKIFVLTGVLGLICSIGCDTEPRSSSGTPTTPSIDPEVTQENYSNPGTNPGLSGAAPHPEPTTGTADPSVQP